MTKLEELLKLNNLTPEDVKDHTSEIAEDAYLTSVYNSILIEMLMEE